MASTNLSVVLYKAEDLRLEQRPIPQPKRGEVQIAMQRVGICGTDVHFWKHGEVGDFVVREPMILGHESSGIVSALGEEVTSLKIGDRVAIEPAVPCRFCDYCKSGRYNLCPDIKCCATPPYDGSLCNFYVHASDFCYKLPHHVSLEEGALLEPLSVAVHACRRAGVTMGHSVLVCGAGPIGLVNLLVAKACGARQVAITDLDEGRLNVAKELGADFILKVESSDSPKEMAKKVEESMGLADITIECTGAESSISTGIYATNSGGVFMTVGADEAEVKMPIVNALCREVDIRGVFRYLNCYPTALDLIASGRVNVKPLVTHHFKLEDSLEAFETSAKRIGGAMKVMIHCGDKE